MRVLSKIFASVVVASLAFSQAACGGSSEPPPQPLSRRFDEMHVAKFTIEQKANIVKARNDWEVSRMENAQAEAQLSELANQMTVVNNEHKSAKLAVDSAVTTKKAADQSADTNRINAATKDLHTAELLLRAAEARVKYFEAFRNYVKRNTLYTAETMYWREAQYELAKAQLAQQNNIAPKGVSFEWYPQQEADRSKKSASRRSAVESERAKAQSARENWLKAQVAADQASGRPTSLPDPMAPTAAPAPAGS
jgi:hypothetical protein